MDDTKAEPTLSAGKSKIYILECVLHLEPPALYYCTMGCGRRFLSLVDAARALCPHESCRGDRTHLLEIESGYLVAAPKTEGEGE